MAKRRSGSTWRRQFFATLAKSGSLDAARAAAGISRQTLWRLRADSAFETRIANSLATYGRALASGSIVPGRAPGRPRGEPLPAAARPIYLDALAQSGSLTFAARAVGAAPDTVRKHATTDAVLAAEITQALETAREVASLDGRTWGQRLVAFRTALYRYGGDYARAGAEIMLTPELATILALCELGAVTRAREVGKGASDPVLASNRFRAPGPEKQLEQVRPATQVREAADLALVQEARGQQWASEVAAIDRDHERMTPEMTLALDVAWDSDGKTSLADMAERARVTVEALETWRAGNAWFREVLRRFGL
jgi:hypothetical protein